MKKIIFFVLVAVSSQAFAQSTRTFQNYMATLPSATTPLAGTEPAIVLQNNLVKQVPISNFGGNVTISAGSFGWNCDSTDQSGKFNTILTTLTNAGGGTLQFGPCQSAQFTASISGTTMTVTAVSSGTLAVNQILIGNGVTGGTVITAGPAGGGTGSYTVSNSQSVSSETMSSGFTYRADSQILIPTVPGITNTSINAAVNIRLTGVGGGANDNGQAWTFAPNASILDLRYNGVNAKIEALGAATLLIDNLAIWDGSQSNNTTVVHTTNTQLIVRDATFVCSGGNTSQKPIVLGGPSSTPGNLVSSAFTGYGTLIDADVFFGCGNLILGALTNSVVIRANQFWSQTATKVVEALGTGLTVGLVITDNLIEMRDPVQYGIALDDDVINSVLAFNSFYDAQVTAVCPYFVGTTNTINNTFIGGFLLQNKVPLCGNASATHTNNIIGMGNGVLDVANNGANTSNSLFGGTNVRGPFTAGSAFPGQLNVMHNASDTVRVSVGVDTGHGIGFIDLGAAGLSLNVNPFTSNPANPTTFFGGIAAPVTNENITGTSLRKLATLTGAPSSAIITTAGATQGSLGIVAFNNGTSGQASIVMSGLTNCTFDGAVVAGDYFGNSASVNGDCTSLGATAPATAQVLGRVLVTNASPGTNPVMVQAGAK